MNPRLSFLVCVLVPGAGPLCAGERGAAVAAFSVALVPVLFGLSWPQYVAAWIGAQLLALFISSRVIRARRG